MASPPELSRPDARILEAVYRYDYLTASQIQRLFYASSAITYVWMRLNFLTQLDVLQRLFLTNHSLRGGAAPSVYTLGQTGQELLRAQGIEAKVRRKPSEELRKAQNDLQMTHKLATTDFLIKGVFA